MELELYASGSARLVKGALLDNNSASSLATYKPAGFSSVRGTKARRSLFLCTLLVYFCLCIKFLRMRTIHPHWGAGHAQRSNGYYTNTVLYAHYPCAARFDQEASSSTIK